MAPLLDAEEVVPDATEGQITLESKLDRLRLHKTSKLPHQKRLSVILEAVEETLNEQTTELCASAYVVAFLSLLSQAFSASELNNQELAAAAIYLLDVVLPHTSNLLLISKFTSILSYLTPLLSHSEASPALVRSAIGCLETILIAQGSSSWLASVSENGPTKALSRLLELSLDDRPKVRKCAQEAITNVLSHPPPGPARVHPALNMCSDLALNLVKQQYSEFTGNSHLHRKQHKSTSRTAASEKKIIFSLQLTRAIARNDLGWPTSKIESLCETLFSISRSPDEFLIMAALDVFQSLFTSMVGESEDQEKIDSSTFAKIVDSIMNLRPAATDQQLAPTWLAIVAQCFAAYSAIDEAKAFARLPILFETISEYLESGLPQTVATSASQCLIALVTTCIPHEILVEGQLTNSTKRILSDISNSALSLLSVKYQAAWKEVFGILVALFDALDFVADPYLVQAVVVIGELRTGEEFEGRAEADDLLSAAIRALGPKKMLEILPLNLENPGPTRPGRAFLLPLLRDSIRNAKLGHFIDYMIPLSDHLSQKVAELNEKEKAVEIKIYSTLVDQIWSLFPRYCDLPTDLRESFNQKYAELIANVLYQKVELRQVCCKSLRIMVESNKMYAEGDIDGLNPFLEAKISKEDAKKNLEYLSAMASKFLAVLFNVFNQTVTEHRQYILDTINAFLSITPSKDISTTFRKVVALLTPALEESAEKKSTPSRKLTIPPVSHTMMDLIVAMVEYLPPALYSHLSTIFVTTIQSADAQVQKRGYRILSKLAQSEEGSAYLIENMDNLENAMISSAEKVTAPARGTRLTALIDIVRTLPSSDLHFITLILPEAVVGTKEVNEKSREAAYQLLVEMGDKMAGGGSVSIAKVPNMDVNAADVDASINEYFTMVSAGLAGTTPHMISATITALSRLLYQYKNILEGKVVSEIVATIDLFLTSKNREIVKAALGFVKVMVTSLPKEHVEPRLETLVPNLLEWAHEHHARFKLKVKHLIERLVRRFGVEMIERVFPEDDKKLLTNIRKSKERARRRKEADETEGGDDEEHQPSSKKKYLSEFEEAIYGSSSDDDDEDVDSENADSMSKKKQNHGGHSRAQKRETYIIGSKDEDPVDFLDQKALARMSSTKPTPATMKSRQNKIKMTESGKMLVDDEETGKRAIDPDSEILEQLAAQAAEANPINAYLDAVQSGPVRGQRNKLKFKNKRRRDDFEEEMRDIRKPTRRAKF
ncbi:NUC173 domain-containing protein [Lipomyces tetrasporus]|uniref:NUC173 domain-containing protein n=1 Tax=Lipomyces tetrasporus TaxID=54092 RepID=A0AAD7QXQ5_9ASCO|nr:NUC173 domain-containing protein [Lipomyces tetrasporus]KAJ8102876.1 NUC173 domain-containing protein [Lipomyces tetrasporus]